MQAQDFFEFLFFILKVYKNLKLYVIYISLLIQNNILTYQSLGAEEMKFDPIHLRCLWFLRKTRQVTPALEAQIKTLDWHSGFRFLIHDLTILGTCFCRAHLPHSNMEGEIIHWERVICYLNSLFSVHSCFFFHLILNYLQ